MSAVTSWLGRTAAVAVAVLALSVCGPGLVMAQEEQQATVVLHVEHPITDLDTWKRNFDANASAREQAGVRSERIWQPVGDPKYIVVDLGFDTVTAAESFRTFLEQRVWSSPVTSPGLAGIPKAVILTEVPVGDGSG